MLRLEVRLLPSALNDLGDIHSFVLNRSGSERIAERYVDRLLAACERVGSAPWGGTLRDDLDLGLRTWSFERTILIAYRIEGDLVEVAKLFYKGRDVEGYFAALLNSRQIR